MKKTIAFSGLVITFVLMFAFIFGILNFHKNPMSTLIADVVFIIAWFAAIFPEKIVRRAKIMWRLSKIFLTEKQ
jgi:hypothetical protein